MSLLRIISIRTLTGISKAKKDNIFTFFPKYPLVSYFTSLSNWGGGGGGGGRVERRCWVNFQCRGVLLLWMIVGQGPIVLAVDAGGGCLDIFSLVYLFSFSSSLSLGDGPI